VLPAEAQEALLHRAPQVRRGRRWLAQTARPFAYVFVLVAAIALAGYFGLKPTSWLLARSIPMSWEQSWGESTSKQLDWFFEKFTDKPEINCRTAAGQAALDDLVGRIAAVSDSPYDFKIRVVDVKMVNAVALPGGYVVVLRGLLDFVEDPDELAAVLAHETAHITERHALQIWIERSIVGFFTDLVFTGGTVEVAGGTAALLLSQSYSRQAEREADALAMARLNAAEIDSRGFGRFFARMEGEMGDVPEMLMLLSSHPPHAERQRLADSQGRAGQPALSPEAWQALQTICD
jgi:Zn-dependent protease with chaperone function